MGKTLEQLNVKLGDVVECVLEPNHNHIGKLATIQENGCAMFDDGCFFMPEYDDEFNREYRIVSRATPEIDLTNITAPLGLLDDATRDALKAHGGPYEEYCVEGWLDSGPVKYWSNTDVIRVKPSPKVEPKPREWWAHPDTEEMTSSKSAWDEEYHHKLIKVREVLE